MYYKEKYENGKWYWKELPDSDWVEFSLEQYAKKCEELQKDIHKETIRYMEARDELKDVKEENKKLREEEEKQRGYVSTAIKTIEQLKQENKKLKEEVEELIKTEINWMIKWGELKQEKQELVKYIDFLIPNIPDKRIREGAVELIKKHKK